MRGLTALTIILVLALASPAVAGSQASAPDSGPPQSQKEAAERPAIQTVAVRALQAAQSHLMAQDFNAARADLQPLVHHPDFATLPPNLRHAVLTMLAWCDLAAGDASAAYTHVTAAGPATGDQSDTFYYYTRALAADMTSHKDEALEILTSIPSAVPRAMSMLDVGYLMTVATYARGKGDNGAARRKLLEAYYGAGYASPEAAVPAERLWFDLFEAEVAAGNDHKATELVAGFSEPEDVIRLTVDNRYAGYLKTTPALADFHEVIEASLRRSRKNLEDHPRSLAAVRDLSYRLANANRLDEALVLVDSTIAKVNAAPKDQPAFDDQAANLQWIYMVRSIVMARLGHREDETKNQETARDSALSGGAASDDVSQPINLGGIYVSEGKAREALDAVKSVDAHVSPYGRMAAMGVRACAYKQLGDTAKLAETMAYMKAHVDDGLMPLRGALECTGDSDALATLLVQRLDNPDTRNQALLWVQGYLHEPETAYEKTLSEVEQKAMADHTVKAAVEKYGSVRSWPVFKIIGD